MSTVVTKRCDVCEFESDSRKTMTWGRFEDLNARSYEVCDNCVAHLFTRSPEANRG